MSDKISQMSDETKYLLSSPANAKELLEAIAEANAGKLVEYDEIPELTEEWFDGAELHVNGVKVGVITQSAGPDETNKP